MLRRTITAPFGTLTIEAPSPDLLGDGVIRSACYRERFAEDEFVVRLGVPAHEPGRGYRAQVARRGIHLGHHVGAPLHVEQSPRHISIYCEERRVDVYERALWTLALKYAFSAMATAHGALHLKATTLVSADGRATLLLGRGASGKTTLASWLREELGFRCVGNTHAFIRNGHAWGMDCWIRCRTEVGEVYSLPPACERPYDGPLQEILVLNHNNHDSFREQRVAPDDALGMLTYFGGGVGTYELKEDLVDGVAHGDIAAGMRVLADDLARIRLLTERVPMSLLSADVFGVESTGLLRNRFSSTGPAPGARAR